MIYEGIVSGEAITHYAMQTNFTFISALLMETKHSLTSQISTDHILFSLPTNHIEFFITIVLQNQTFAGMLLALFLTLLVILPCSASEEFQKIGFKDCKSSFKITDVQASGCTVKDAGNNKKLCEFQAGTTPKIRITFNSDEMAPSLTAQIKAKIGETFLEFPMADNDACQSGISCPIEVGKTYTYEKGIEIINNYPKDETVQVNWMLNKNGKEKGICIVFLVRIVV